jgi:acyl-coenzyme A synthetase/AMP-(fatty) acid ligase
LDHKSIIRYCRNNLASFKVPHELVELTELPKTTSGKIKKNLLQGSEVQGFKGSGFTENLSS